MPLVAAVDVEYCMYAHRIFFRVLSILLLASKLLARSLQGAGPWTERRGVKIGQMDIVVVEVCSMVWGF